jgi:hypothetical protein
MALSIFLSSLVLFIVCARLFTMEKRSNQRFFAGGIRSELDIRLTQWGRGIDRNIVYLSRYIITLSWYYSLHTLLKLALRFLASVYTVVEALLHFNRTRARIIRTEHKRREPSHLAILADHKAETQLTASQKQKRKDAALRGR